MSNSGWNRPAANEPKVTKKSGKKFSLLHGLIAGAVVVVLGFAVLAILSGGDNEPKAKAAKDRGLIKAVTPAAAPTNRVEKNEHPGMVEVRGKWYPEYDEKGGRIWVRSKDVTYHTPVVITNAVNPRRRSKESKIFKEYADAEIAILLNGENMLFLGPYKYGQRFVDDFLHALKTPITINPDDDDETRLLKEAVIETRKDLKKRYDAGEDIAKIMDDTRKDLQELSMYREDLRKQVVRLADEKDFEGKDLEELLGAANAMLAERGAKPLSAPSMFKHRMNFEAKKINKGAEK